MSESVQVALLRQLREDRWLAHQHLFRHRHPNASPDAHRDLVSHINRPLARLAIEGFRGFAKSTYLEETAVLKAAYREFHFLVILGASYKLACDRLASIKREFEINELVESLFGPLKGETWQEGKIVLANGVCIQAIGREQSMTGMKYLDHRPDAALVDDLEDPDEMRTDPEREKTWDWFLKTFLPSLSDPVGAWVRELGTRRGVGSLPERLQKTGWTTVKFPIEHLDDEGERRATWPDKFPLEKIDAMKLDYVGDMDTWVQEYMCEATSTADRIFKREMFRVEPRVRNWEPVYAMIDPARTVRATSATTGWAVWSWVANRLVVWAAGAPMLLPDEIVALAFDIVERFDPVFVGIEQDGLEEWLLQLIRHEQTRRGITIPYRGMRAPRGKLDFIRGLQPYFGAREVIFAQPLTELETQLLSFPHGKIDAPNALAYAPLMRPAAPIYDGFSVEAHVDPELQLARGRPLYLAANATGALTTAVLAQAFDGRLLIFADWVCEGSPGERVADIAGEAALLGDTAIFEAHREGVKSWEAMLKLAAPEAAVLRRMPIVWTVGARHGERYTNVGLMQAVKTLPAEQRIGGAELDGANYLREMLERTERGLPVVSVGTGARWTLRALSGGYGRAIIRGKLQDHAEEGPYRVLMEGLEAFCGMIRGRVSEDEANDDNEPNYRYSRDGRRYLSAMPARTR
jgi:hypothetical protein